MCIFGGFARACPRANRKSESLDEVHGGQAAMTSLRRRCAKTVVFFVLAGCAGAPPLTVPGTQSWSNLTSALDSPCLQGGRCQRYVLDYGGGQTITLRLAAGAPAVVHASVGYEWNEVSQAIAEAQTPGLARFTLEGGPDDSKTVTVQVETPMHAPAAEYTLEIEPAPRRVNESPTPKSARIEKLAASERARQESVASQERTTEEIGRQEADRKAIEAAEAAVCRKGNRPVSRVMRPDRNEIFRFCDDTTVRRAPGGEWTVTIGLKGYEAFTSRERAAMEVAEHNAKVLNTDLWKIRSGQARAAFEAKVQAFVAKNRWPQARYVEEAKRSRLTATAD